MIASTSLNHDGKTLTVRVPMSLHRRGGRKLIVAPDGSITPPTPRTQTRSALVKALAQAHRWQKLLDAGEYATVAELAAADKVNASYASRVLRMTLLAPDIVEAILDGRQTAGVTLEALLRPLPAGWEGQCAAFLA